MGIGVADGIGIGVLVVPGVGVSVSDGCVVGVLEVPGVGVSVSDGDIVDVLVGAGLTVAFGVAVGVPGTTKGSANACTASLPWSAT